jgi:YggT family protein
MLAVGLLPSSVVGIISLVITLLILAILVRVVLSYFPAMRYSQLAIVLDRTTDWIIVPIRRVVPPVGGLDLSPAIAILLLYFISNVLATSDIVQSLVGLLLSILAILILLLFIRVFFSFFRLDPWNPIVQMVVRASEPFARPFRSWFGGRRNAAYYSGYSSRPAGFDWAPIAALVVMVAIYVAISYVRPVLP